MINGLLYVAEDWTVAREGDELRDHPLRQMRLQYPDLRLRGNFRRYRLRRDCVLSA